MTSIIIKILEANLLRTMTTKIESEEEREKKRENILFKNFSKRMRKHM